MLRIGVTALGVDDLARATTFWAEARVHLDLLAPDLPGRTAEIERLQHLGATVVDWDSYPPDPDFVVLADTEGNRFCLIDASHVKLEDRT